MNRNLVVLTLLVASLTAVSCGRSMLLTDLTKQVDRLNEPIVKPSIVPAGGVFRNPAGVPMINLSSPTPGSTLIYNTENAPLSFNLRGQTIAPTKADPAGLQTWAAGTLFLTYGLHTIQAQGLRDGKVSDLARADFRIVGDGGTIWAQAGLGVGGGEVTAVAQAPDESVYVVGWTGSLAKPSGFIRHFDAAGRPMGNPIVLPQYSRIYGAAFSTMANTLVVVGTLTSDTQAYDFGGSWNLGITGKNPLGFVALYDPSLGCQWAIAPDNYSSFTGVATYGTTQALVVGNIIGPVSFNMGGSLTLTTPHLGAGASNGIVFSVDVSARAVAVGKIMASSTSGAEEFLSIATDSTTNTFAISGSVTPNGGPVTFPGGFNATGQMGVKNPLILRGLLSGWPSTPALSWTWSAGMSTVTPAEFLTVTIDRGSGAVVAGGYTQGTGGFSGFAGSSSGTNAILAKLFNTGSLYQISGPFGPSGGDSKVRAVVHGLGGAFYAVGELGAGTYNWSGQTIGGSSLKTPFLVKSLFPPGIDWFRTTGPTGAELSYASLGQGIPTAPNRLPIGGTLTGGPDADLEDGLVVHAPNPGPNPFLSMVFD